MPCDVYTQSAISFVVIVIKYRKNTEQLLTGRVRELTARPDDGSMKSAQNPSRCSAQQISRAPATNYTADTTIINYFINYCKINNKVSPPLSQWNPRIYYPFHFHFFSHYRWDVLHGCATTVFNISNISYNAVSVVLQRWTAFLINSSAHHQCFFYRPLIFAVLSCCKRFLK